VQRSATVRAAIVQGVNRPVAAHEHELDVGERRRGGAVLGQHARVEHGRPIVRAVVEGRLVDADAACVREIASEPAACSERAGAREAEPAGYSAEALDRWAQVARSWAKGESPAGLEQVSEAGGEATNLVVSFTSSAASASTYLR